MREFAQMVGMVVSATIGVAVMLGVALNDWHLAWRLGGYGALACAGAGVVYACGYAVARGVSRLVRKVVDKKSNR